jgi:hypothetical protein
MNMDMDLQHGQGHGRAACRWTHSMDMDLHHGYGHAASTWTYNMDMDMIMDMDINHGMGMDKYHECRNIYV